MKYLIIGSDYVSLPYVIDFDGTEDEALERIAEEEKTPKLAGYRPFFLVDLEGQVVHRIVRAGSDEETEWKLVDEARTLVGIETPDEYFEEQS